MRSSPQTEYASLQEPPGKGPSCNTSRAGSFSSPVAFRHLSWLQGFTKCCYQEAASMDGSMPDKQKQGREGYGQQEVKGADGGPGCRLKQAQIKRWWVGGMQQASLI